MKMNANVDQEEKKRGDKYMTPRDLQHGFSFPRAKTTPNKPLQDYRLTRSFFFFLFPPYPFSSLIHPS